MVPSLATIVAVAALAGRSLANVQKDGRWCMNTNGLATNSYTNNCSSYKLIEINNCNWGDDEDFTANSMCCACGGGTTKVPTYVGCFADNTSDRDLGTRVGPVGTPLTLEQCAGSCAAQGYQFFGRQWEGECFCSNSYGKHGRATDCRCSAANIGGDKNCVYSLSSAEAMCDDTENGAKDRDNNGCAGYYWLQTQDWCGMADDADFSAQTMCCACGGGSPKVDGELCFDKQVTDANSQSHTCKYYWSRERTECGTHDTSAFNAMDQCCACEGGNREVITSTLTTTATVTTSSSSSTIRNRTNATIVRGCQTGTTVCTSMRFNGVDYVSLTQNATLSNQFKAAVANTLASQLGVSRNNVTVVLSAGSVIAEAQVATAPDVYEVVLATLQSSVESLQQAAADAVLALPNIASVSTGDITVDQVDVQSTSSGTSTSPPSNEATSAASATGAIVGGTVGGAAGILGAAAAYLLYKKKMGASQGGSPAEPNQVTVQVDG